MNDTHLRIAITTNSLIGLDANFVAARQMVFYDVSRDASEFVDVVHFSRSGKAKKGPGGGKGCVMDDMDDDGTGHDPMTERVASLVECSVLFTLGLSDLAAVRVLLNAMRSIPGLIWGVLFVAAVGFGPLPGIFALACHSTGVLGKFYSEIFEHVDRAPGEALRSHGVSPLGVFRLSVWPQVLPRLMDATIYRWEHNVRAATTLGVVGAGGLGLEIVTAFHLFEYREAAALVLVLVLLALVTLLNGASAWLRRRFLGAR